MNISTFKDEKYVEIDKISVFPCVIVCGKKVPQCLYQHENNPSKLLELAKGLREDKASFARLFDKSLSDVEFFEIYKQFYRWDSNAIIANINAELFPNPKTTIIKTNDVDSSIVREGHDKDFSWWTEWRHVEYEVLTNADFQFEDRVYTKKEIAQLVRQGELVVLRQDIPYGDELDKAEVDKIKKDLANIDVSSPLHHKFGFYGYALDQQDIEEMSAANPKAIPVIRQDLTNERLQADYKKYLVAYDYAMGMIDARLEVLLAEIKEQYSAKITPIERYLASKHKEATAQTPEKQHVDITLEKQHADSEMAD